MKSVSLNGKLIAYQHKPSLTKTIVFANCLGSNQSIWDDVIAALPTGYGIVTYDMAGHGLSDADAVQKQNKEQNTSIQSLADDVIALIEYLELKDVIFCGVSIGGMVAQSVCYKRPDLIDRAIFCNTSFKIGSADRWNARISDVETNGFQALAKDIVSSWFGKAYNTDKADQLKLHENMLSQNSVAGYVECCKAIREADLLADIKQINVPVLCVAGDEDQSVSASQVKEMADNIPNAQLEVITGLGHLPCLEMPEKLADLIDAFNQDTSSGYDKGKYEQGMAIRKKVLSPEHVAKAEKNKTAFDQAFQTLITEGAWGSVWHSTGISSRERSMLTLALLAATGNFEEIPMHIRATARTGATEKEIAEAFQHVAIYAGVPKANHALKIAKQTLKELNEAEKS